MDFKSNLIKSNKCIVGETYYLTGLDWDYVNFTCLINTPVVFHGRNKSLSNVGKSWANYTGQFEFSNEKEDIYIARYAQDELFIKPYIDGTTQKKTSHSS